MIIPSIDISGGTAVQLVGGERPVVDAGDPRPIFERFSVVGEVAVVDIDAARGEGGNTELIRELCRRGRTRVGGGIRDAATALRWLDEGASKVVLGTAANPEVLSRLPRDRVVVALDSRDGRIVTHGWRRQTDLELMGAVGELRGLCAGFLVTFVEREGRLQGTDLERARRVVDAADGTSVTIAGGISTVEEIEALDRIGADAQVGMALYTAKMSLSEGFAAPLRSERADGLWPTVLVDEAGHALGLAWSNGESLREAIETRRGVYTSRSRGRWVKGATSGETQELIAVDVDCDRDTLRFTVRQTGGFCHNGTRTCWGEDRGAHRLARRLAEIAAGGNEGNTARLLGDEALLAAKITEEAAELAESNDASEVIAETADLLYFSLVKAVSAGVTLDQVETELDRRAGVVSRRPMTAREGG